MGFKPANESATGGVLGKPNFVGMGEDEDPDAYDRYRDENEDRDFDETYLFGLYDSDAHRY